MSSSQPRKVITLLAVAMFVLAGCGSHASQHPGHTAVRHSAGFVRPARGYTASCFAGPAYEDAQGHVELALTMAAAESGAQAAGNGDWGYGYAVTIINHGTAPVEVGGFQVALYEGTAQSGSDSEQADGVVMAGGMLTWTFGPGLDDGFPQSNGCELVTLTP